MSDTGIYDSDSDVSYEDSELDSETETLPDVNNDSDLEHGQDQPEQDRAAAQAAKAIEAATEHSPTAPSTNSRLPSPAPSSIWPADASERRPLLDAGPAPPDYAAATASRGSSLRSGLRERLTRQDVESSGGSIAPSLSSRKKKKTWRQRIRRSWKPICLALVLYCGLTILILAVRKALKTNDETSLQSSLYFPEHPQHHLRYPPEKFHTQTPECHFDTYSEFVGYGSASDGNFSFVENLSRLSRSNGRISGKVEVRPAPYGQIGLVEVYSNVATTAPWKVPRLDSVFRDDNSLELRFPSLDEEDLPPCLSIWIGIYVKGPMEHWETHTGNLDVDVGSPRSLSKEGHDWTLKVRNETKISTVGGNVSTSRVDSRKMHIETTSGSITGTYSFWNELSFKTASGDIAAAVEFDQWQPLGLLSPRYNFTAPAKLRTETASGNTKVDILQIGWGRSRPENDPFLLNSYHYSRSGSVSLGLSPWWEGIIDGKSTNGSTMLDSDEFKMLPAREPTETDNLRARLGLGNSTASLETIEGDVLVYVNDLLR